MLFIVLILVLTALVLGGLLWVGTLVLQGWLYETPVGELYWRAPAVGAGLAVLYGLWVLVDAMMGASGSMFGSVATDRQYDQIRAVVKRDGKDSPEETYNINKASTPPYYVLVGPNGQPTTTRLPPAPERIIIEEDGKLGLQVDKVLTEEGGKPIVQPGAGARDFTIPVAARVTIDGKPGKIGDVKAGDSAAVTAGKDGTVAAVDVAASPPTTAPAGATVAVGKVTRAEAGKTSVFEPERKGSGQTFKREQGQSLHYYDKNGRSIDEGDPGHVEAFHWDRLLWNTLFHVLHLGLWFAGLWVVLRFQWPHTLGLALCLWLVMTLFLLPMILDYAEGALKAVGK